MRILSVFLFLFMFITTGCNVKTLNDTEVDASEYLEISVTSPLNPASNVNDGSSISNPDNNVASSLSQSTIDIHQYVLITLTSEIDVTTVDASSVYILDENQIPVPAELIVSGETISIIPIELFVADATYTVFVTTAVKDVLGRSLENPIMFSLLTVDMTADTTAPTLTSLTPADGAIDVDKTTDVTMTFNENIANNGVTLEVKDSLNTLITGINTVSANTLTFNPTNDLAEGESYTVTLTGNIEDLTGNTYTGITTWSFRVAPLVDSIPPTLTSLTPVDNAINVDKATDVIMTFDENIANNGVTLDVRDSLNNPVAGTNTVSANTLIFNPTSDLTYAESYRITMQGSVEDLYGNSYAGVSTWSFTTAPVPDTTPPTLISVIPSDGAIHVDPATDINVTFDEDVTSGSPVLLLTDNTLGISVAGTSGGTANTLSFIPDSVLIEGHNYTIDIHGSIRDLAGNNYTGETSWSFTVAPLVDSTPPNLTSLTPEENATNVDKTTNVVMTFDENIADNGVTLEVRDSLNALITGTNTVSTNTLNFNPTNDLTEDESYTVTVIGNVEDLSTNVYTGTSTWSFTVAPLVDITPPALISLTPVDNETNVDKTTNVVMTFDENIADNGVTLEVRDSLNALVTGTNTINTNTLTFNPTSDLTEGESYTVTLTGNIEDLNGNIYTGVSTWSFTVISLPSGTLTVIRIENANDKIKIEFYEKLDKSVVSESDFLINGGAISFSGFKFSGGDHKVEFTAATPLIGDEIITVSGTVKDINGNLHNGGIAADYSIAGVLSVYDVKKGEGDTITVKFWEISSILDPSTVDASDFLINGGAIGFSGLIMKNDYDVEFIADTELIGDELITISGDIQDMDGNFHNNGVAVSHTF